jgi:hypothetical protein
MVWLGPPEDQTPGQKTVLDPNLLATAGAGEPTRGGDDEAE